MDFETSTAYLQSLIVLFGFSSLLMLTYQNFFLAGVECFIRSAVLVFSMLTFKYSFGVFAERLITLCT